MCLHIPETAVICTNSTDVGKIHRCRQRKALVATLSFWKKLHMCRQVCSPDCMLVVSVIPTLLVSANTSTMKLKSRLKYLQTGFFYETVAPLLCIGNTSFIAISTLTSEMNFYTVGVRWGCLYDSWYRDANDAREAHVWIHGITLMLTSCNLQKLISKMDQLTNLPVFKSIQISLACQACIDAEKAHEWYVFLPMERVNLLFFYDDERAL